MNSDKNDKSTLSHPPFISIIVRHDSAAMHRASPMVVSGPEDVNRQCPMAQQTPALRVVRRRATPRGIYVQYPNDCNPRRPRPRPLPDSNRPWTQTPIGPRLQNSGPSYPKPRVRPSGQLPEPPIKRNLNESPTDFLLSIGQCIGSGLGSLSLAPWPPSRPSIRPPAPPVSCPWHPSRYPRCSDLPAPRR